VEPAERCYNVGQEGLCHLHIEPMSDLRGGGRKFIYIQDE